MEDDASVRYQRMGYSGSSEEDLATTSTMKSATTAETSIQNDEDEIYDHADPLPDSVQSTIQRNGGPPELRRLDSNRPGGYVKNKYRRFENSRESLGDTSKLEDPSSYSDSELKNKSREVNFSPYVGQQLQEFNRTNEPNMRNRGMKRSLSRPEGLNSGGSRGRNFATGVSEEVELRRGRFNYGQTPVGEEDDVFHESTLPSRPQSMGDPNSRNVRLHNAKQLNRISSFSMPHDISYHPPKRRYRVSSDGQKMVLQLVLPQSGLENIKQEPPITPDYIHYELFKPRKGYNNVQPDLFHRHPDTPQFEYSSRGLGLSSSEIGIPDRSELTVTSLGDSGSSDAGDPPSSSPEEKIKMFRGYLTTILSCVYAVFIVTLGVVVYVSDIVLQNGTPLAESFSLYLVVLGLVYFAFLYADIRRYLGKVNSRNSVLLNKDDISIKDSGIACHTSSEGNLHLSIPLPSKLAEDPLPHNYCFSKGRHSGSFYLKVGAAGFCFGHLIHSGLMLGYQIVYLTSDGEDFYNCASVAILTLDILYPVYSFLQLFFIFKYSNVIIIRCQELARFAVMHCIASSLCFWIWTILRETLDSLNSYAKNDSDSIEEENSSESADSFENSVALPLTMNQQIGANRLIQCLNETSWWVTGQCKPPAALAMVANQFSPYLYPFTIEYSILVVGILFIIWQNIGKCSQDHSDNSICPAISGDGTHSNLVIHADCHSANKGLFAGLIVLVGSIISIILFCIAMADNEFITMGLTVNAISELILLLLMTVAVILAYRKLTQLDINYHPISLLDDLLLFICIPAFFLYGIFSIVPAVLKANGLSIAITLLQVIQVLLQTPFIIDGLRRCSNTRQLRLAKPGRELVTFLVVCNVAMWITETFEIKSHDKRDDRYDIYGKVLWTMMSHMTVPLTMFYRFHSSVCLVDIWKSAYEKGE